MESSPESVRPVKRVKYAQQDDAIPLNTATSSIRTSDTVNEPLVTDVPLFDNTWPMTTELSSPSEVLFNLPEDLGNSWAPAFTGKEVNLLSLTPCPHLPHLTHLSLWLGLLGNSSDPNSDPLSLSNPCGGS
jgi:hypothetical protein